MLAARVLLGAIGLVLALAGDGFAGPVTTTTTTTTNTTTSQGPPPCIGDVEVDPDDTVASLTPEVLSAMPIRVTITSGIMDLVPNDGGAGGSFTGQCSGVPIGGLPGQPFTLACNYTPSASPPAQITIQANLTPHSGGGTACGAGSTADSDSKTFPVATPTTSSTTTTTSSTSSSTHTSTSSTTSTTATSSTTMIPHGRIAVCHKGRSTLLVDAAALGTHLGHGDREGPCAQ